MPKDTIPLWPVPLNRGVPPARTKGTQVQFPGAQSIRAAPSAEPPSGLGLIAGPVTSVLLS
jgi:hypothetical protein